ncbi:MAG: LysM peptidoglycan-binding domain-containing protein [Bacteroidales bacterium]|nr:LysM peptidoglycan-binding domain-containing protein [Bacteroidales bacterium]MBN2633942.1 LysM peptidoglycan-binding domain-containing protein [Bacteroidales bacterium]
MKGYLVVLMVLSSPGLSSLSQVAVERSTNKVIISGTPYYIHVVKKGETAYSVAREYGITVEELTRENPPALYGLNEGQSLRIAVKQVSDVKPAGNVVREGKRDEERYIYHNLQPGETIYFLSKHYGVSEREIIESNPGVEISRLPVNSEIAIPRRVFRTEREDFAVQDSNYIFHKVVRGESLASIAEKYNLTVRELRRENRNLRFPQVGDYIRIPVPRSAIKIPDDKPEADTLVVKEEQLHFMLETPSAFTPVSKLTGSFDIAVLLPFYLRENSVRADIDSSQIVKGKRVYKTVKRAEDWIYPGSTGFLEMYEGILLALDTLSSMGLDIHLHTYDIRSDTIELTRLINQGALEKMDLIIGPVYTKNLVLISEYARENGIPVVSPVPLFNNTVLKENPNLFMANASLEVAQKLIAEKAEEYFDNNIVFIHTDTAGIDPDIRNFRDKIFAELCKRIPFDDIRFKEFIFYSRSAFNNDSINRLGHALSQNEDNVIIIASEEAPVISETIMEIHSLSKQYPVRVMGYPAMRTLDNLEPKFFFDLDIVMFSPSWIDYSRRDVKQFTADFRKKFLTEPQEFSYAWLGYDITYYFLSGLAVHGRNFLSNPEIHNPDLLQTRFDFRRRNINDGFENYKLYEIKYSSGYEVILMPEETDEY